MTGPLKTEARCPLRWISARVCLLLGILLGQLSPNDAPAALAADVAIATATSATASDLSAEVTVTISSGSEAATREAAPGALSVALAGPLRYPEDRPSWIDAGPSLSGKVHRWPVSSPPSSTPELSRRALQVQLRAAAETYLETLLDAPEAPAVIALSDDWILARLTPDHSYEGEIDTGDEVLYEAAAELRFDPQDRAWIEAQWTSHRVRNRLIGLGAMTIGGTLLLLMATAGLSIAARRAERPKA